MNDLSHLKHAGWPLIGSILVFFLHVPYLAEGPGGWDDVDFALALNNFDISLMQPHFPGYPIYILAAFAVRQFLSNNYLALSYLSTLACALSCFPIYFVFRRINGSSMAVSIVLLWVAAPLTWVLGTQPLSDSFGAFLAFMVVWLSALVIDPLHKEKVRAVALVFAGIFLALLYGVRISYLIIGVVPVWAGYIYFRDTGQWMDCVRGASAAMLTCLFWLLSIAQNVGGWPALWQLGMTFTEGHFSDWGGTFHENDSVTDRLFYWVGRQLLAAGLGAPWSSQSMFSYGVLIALLAALYALFFRGNHLREKMDSRWMGLLLAWGLPYLLWAFFAQNVDKPRHLLPLLPLLLWTIARGLTNTKKKVIYFLLLPSMLVVGWTQVQPQANTDSPMVQLANCLAMQPISATESTLTFTYEEARVINEMYPQIRTVRLRKFKDFQVALLNEPNLPTHIYLTNSVLEGFQDPEVKGMAREVGRFMGSVWLYPTYHTIILYELDRDKVTELLHL